MSMRIACGDRWLAERLAAGDVDHAVFQTVRQLLDGRMAPDQAVALAEATLARCELGEVRLALCDALVKLGRKAEAEAYVEAVRRRIAALARRRRSGFRGDRASSTVSRSR